MRVRAYLIAVAAFCLVCIGVHAAADRTDDIIQAGISPIDAFIDSIVSAWSVTRPLADWIDSALIVKVSRALALVAELAVALLLARATLRKPLDLERLKLNRQTALRPAVTVAFVLLGASAIATVVHGAIFIDGGAVIGKIIAGISFACTLLILGPPALTARTLNVALIKGLRYVEAATIALCFYVAVYRTPPGALLRSLLGIRTAPLLSYYSGGVVRAYADTVTLTPVLAPPSPAEALGLGAKAAYLALPADKRNAVASRMAGYGMKTQDTESFTRAIKELSKSRHETEAVLALFAGEKAAAFAATRSAREDLETLAQVLPPGLENEVTAASKALSYARAYGLGWPLANAARVTSGFGWRMHPISGERLFHKGLDLSIPVGTEVRATGPGVVVRSSEDASNGHIVVIDHGNGVRTLYLHNSERFVGRGQHVVTGQPVARSGATGIATGPHLHYQLELGSIPHDPASFRSNRP